MMMIITIIIKVRDVVIIVIIELMYIMHMKSAKEGKTRLELKDYREMLMNNLQKISGYFSLSAFRGKEPQS